MKKVNWSTRREIVGSTWVVIVITFALAAMLFGIDLLFAAFFGAIDLLQTG
jgi:preprotein translocase SecE subunit